MHIREACHNDAESIATIHVDNWRTTYKGIVPADYLAALSYKERSQMWQQILTDAEQSVKQITFVAENANNEIIGFMSGGVNRDNNYPYDAELYAIYLQPDLQQKGLGSQLVLTLVKWLVEHRYQSMLVWVLEKNSACKFYQVLGGKRLSTCKIASFNDVQLVEVAYGWESLEMLLGLLQK